MLVIALCSVLAGGEDCTDMAEFATAKRGFLRDFLKLKHGPPSHATFSRLFRRLDPEQFRACFQRFMARFAEACQGVIAIDGKVPRRSFDKASGKSPPHMVSARACEQQLVPRQIATAAKSNEVTAVSKLLKLISLEGGTVTVDALNCQPTIAQQVSDQKGEYVVVLKSNQASLHDDVRRFLDDPASQVVTAKPAVDGDHGRIETRAARVSTDIGWLQALHDWPDLRAVGKRARVCERGDKITIETAYYLLSAAMTPERFGEITRAHWGSKNQLHWRLDASMNEDQARNRIGNGSENLAVLRRMALNLLREEPSRRSLPKKLCRAALNDAFLANLLAQV